MYENKHTSLIDEWPSIVRKLETLSKESLDEYEFGEGEFVRHFSPY